MPRNGGFLLKDIRRFLKAKTGPLNQAIKAAGVVPILVNPDKPKGWKYPLTVPQTKRVLEAWFEIRGQNVRKIRAFRPPGNRWQNANKKSES